MSSIKDLEPKVVWNNFYSLTQIPRPSKHEQKAQEFLYNWGKEHGIETIRDHTGNIIFRVPATPGYENRRGVILQGHMDMVPQKVASSDHDFLKDPIQTEILGDWVGAKGTTLGADNGMGIALGMAVCESKDIKHGPVEVLATYDEETGMTGAQNLKPGVLKGDILINLDSEEEGELCIGCAGGLDAIADFKYKSTPVPRGYKAYKVEVKGLQGGHSGMDIALYRGNANKLVTRAIVESVDCGCALLAKFTGGSLRNAIPFEAQAIILVTDEKKDKVLAKIAKNLENSKKCFAQSDPDMKYSIEPCDKPRRYIEQKVAANALKAILACPSGVIRMSQSMPGLTETSTNLAIVRSGRGHIKVASLMRSAIDASKAGLAKRIGYIFELAGAKVTFTGGYSGWIPKPDLPIIKVMKNTYKDLFGKEMKVFATHGGLECALMGATYPNWEMVSIGPTIVHPHSPDERVKIDTVGMCWEYLKAVLENIPCK